MAPKVLVKKGMKMDRVKAKKGFDVPAQAVGTSKWTGSDGKPVTVYAQTGTSNDAGILALAQDIQAKRIDDIMAFCDRVYAVKGASGNVIIDSGSSGAYHYGCDFTTGGDWYEDDFGASGPTPNNNGGLTTGLVMAEVCESYMGLHGAGWKCGGSGGEALSRICAETASGGIAGAMSGGFSARSSYDGSDWISKDQGSDQDYPSIGCGMLYLDWMRTQGFTLDQIVQAGEPDGSLASNYAKLTGKPAAQAFADFTAALAGKDVNATNPFNITDTPFPGGSTPPPTPPPPTGLGTLTVTSALAPGTYSVVSGTTVYGTITATQAVPPGTYQIESGGPPPSPPSGTLTVPAALAPGSYTIHSVGAFSLTQALAPGASYSLQASTGTGGVNVDGEKLNQLLRQLFETGQADGGLAANKAFRGIHLTTLHMLVGDALEWSDSNIDKSITIPPFVLALLHFLCILAPTLPPPYGPLAQQLCALLPGEHRCATLASCDRTPRCESVEKCAKRG